MGSPNPHRISAGINVCLTSNDNVLTEETYEREACTDCLCKRKRWVARLILGTYEGYYSQVVFPYHGHSRLPSSDISQH